MAARVQQQLEDMVPELHKLKELQLFSEEEVRDIVKRRRKYEYMVISTDPVYAINSYKEYIKYELKLDKELQRRLRQSKNEATRTSVSDRVPSEKRSVPVRVTVRRRIHRIFKRCLTRFVTAIDLWKEYCAFCYRIKAYGVMNRAIMSALAKNPSCEDLWRLATKYTLTLKGSLAARHVIQMALRTNPKSLEMFTLLLELEVQSTNNLFQFSLENDSTLKTEEENLELSSKTWTIIMNHAVRALEGSDIFKMLLFGASICSRVRRASAFFKELKGYDEFASTIFDEMFKRRHEHPLLGLYIWQHRLLESLLVQKRDGEEDAPSPESVFVDLLQDCQQHEEMIPPVSHFIKSVVATPEGSQVNEHNEEASVFVIDVQGDQATGGKEDTAKNSRNEIEDVDDDMDQYCNAVECIKDVCFLRAPSPRFDEVNESCRYTKGILNRKGLIEIRNIYRTFLSEKVKETANTVGVIIENTESGGNLAKAFVSSSNELLRFIMSQVSLKGLMKHSIGGYLLAVEVAKQSTEDRMHAFTDMINQNLLNAIVDQELKETTRSKALLAAVGSPNIKITAKLEVTRKSALSLTKQQLESSVHNAVQSITDDTRMIELVLSLMAASSSVLIEDFIQKSEVVNRIFTAIQRRIPEVTDALKKYKTNKLGLRNFGLLSVVVSLWLVHFKMQKLNSEIKQTECSEFLNDNCEVVSQVYATEAREIIDLCETAVTSSKTVNITDSSRRNEFCNRCWNIYLRCAKDLEQLDLLVPIFNLHTFNVSSDVIAARALAQLGKNFVFNKE